jgi:hypothetical protein
VKECIRVGLVDLHDDRVCHSGSNDEKFDEKLSRRCVRDF